MPDNNALHAAAKAGDIAQVQSQVSYFDINAKGQYDRTALCLAADGGYPEVVKLLLTLNADVNIPDVSTLKMITVHLLYLICVSSIPPISVLHLDSYTSRHVPFNIISNITICRFFITSFALSPSPTFRISLSLGHSHTYTHTKIYVPHPKHKLNTHTQQ